MDAGQNLEWCRRGAAKREGDPNSAAAAEALEKAASEER